MKRLAKPAIGGNFVMAHSFLKRNTNFAEPAAVGRLRKLFLELHLNILFRVICVIRVIRV